MQHRRAIGWAAVLLLAVGCREKPANDPRPERPESATPSPGDVPAQPEESAQPASDETKAAWDALQYEAPSDTVTASPSPSPSPSAPPRAGLRPLPLGAPPASSPASSGSDVSETDKRRAAGEAEFERTIMDLAAKADQADIAWRRYVAGCHREVANMEEAAVAGGRAWFATAWSSARSTWVTDTCSEAGAFFALVSQVKRGMCAAEDDARRAAVYPGTRRDVRRRYRMDWDGWDRICS